MKLWQKILVGLVAGVILGLTFGEKVTGLKIIGDLFIQLISMVIAPLVFSSMTLGITSIHDPDKLGRIGFKSLLLYGTTTAISIVLGIGLAMLVRPGSGLPLGTGYDPTELDVTPIDAKPLSQILMEIIPNNPISALSSNDSILQVIVFAVFLGLAINFAGAKGKPLLSVIESLSDVMYRLTSIIMEFAPYGVFGSMAWVAGKFGADVLKGLVWFLVCNYVGCLIHVAVIYCGILWFMARLNPIPFFKGMGDAIMFGLSTASSSATLPVSLHCVQENLGVSRNIANFILPLGSTVNMNGTALYQGVTVVFIAQAYGIDLSLEQLGLVVVTGTMSAVGAAGIPGTGYIMLSAVLRSAGLPVDGLQLIGGIDRIREMVSVAVNIMGDAVVAVYIARSEGELDEAQYYHTELTELELEMEV